MSTKKADDLEALDEQRHKRAESAAGSERWLISYADFMTLLLAFFIVMFSISQVNKAKVEGFEQSMRVAFGGKPPVMETAPPKANSPFHHLPSPVPLIAVPPAVAQAIRKQELDMMRMQNDLEKVLQPLIKAHEISVTHTPTGTRVRINASVLFANGSAKLQPKALHIIDAVGLILKPFNYRIFVEGYTNNQPMRSAKYPSNWYLSSSRALSVLNRFLLDGVNPSLLSVVGRGKYHPAIPYTKKTMQKAMNDNRRVTIAVQGNTRIIMSEIMRMVENRATVVSHGRVPL